MSNKKKKKLNLTFLFELLNALKPQRLISLLHFSQMIYETKYSFRFNNFIMGDIAIFLICVILTLVLLFIAVYFVSFLIISMKILIKNNYIFHLTFALLK